MNLAQIPELLALEIDEIIVGATDLTCVPDIDTVWTAGEPAAPTGQCTVVWVWISELYNVGGQAPFGRQGDSVGCVIRPAVTLNIRVDVCYEETEQDPTAVMHADTADCFYRLIGAIWCGLADRWAAGDLIGFNCQESTLSQFQIGQRLGGVVSATMTVDVEYDCAGAAS
jgi:hypothetical protein